MKSVIAAILTIGIISCSSMQQSPKKYKEAPFQPSMVLNMKSNPPGLYFNLFAQGDLANDQHLFLVSISRAIAVIYYKSKIVDTVKFDRLDASSLYGRNSTASTTLHARTDLYLPDKYNAADYSIHLLITTDSAIYENVFPLEKIILLATDTTAMFDLTPSIGDITDSSATFYLKAERLKTKMGEYFPTSETLRVQILSKKGVLEWSSDNNMNFLQVITSVLPVNLGEPYTYSVKWNGRKNDGTPLKKGTYNAIMMLVMNPRIYTKQITFDWNGHE
jgi:hypothetical protein